MGQLLLLAALFLIATQLSPAQVKPTGPPAPFKPFTPLPPSPLKLPQAIPFRGTREFIRWVQKSINTIMQTSLTVDGLLGPLTKEAIISYQSVWGLVEDGIPGPNTEAAIKEDLQSGTTYFS